MKQRLLSGWNFQRVAFVAMGGLVIGTSLAEHQWVGLPFGGYFALMGLLGLGCAGGNCAVPTSYDNPQFSEEVEFEEIKSK